MDFLRMLKTRSSLLWIVVGDNDLVEQSEKRGRHLHPEGFLQGFREALENCSLHHIPVSSIVCTWERGRGTEEWVEERLDMAVGSMEWNALYEEAKLLNINTFNSYHNALFLDLHARRKGRALKRGVRFENAWLLEDGYRGVVENTWSESRGLDLQARLDFVDRN